MSTKLGVLYVVATPIGNLNDMSARASDVLSRVRVIFAEDTRTSKRLLMHLGVSTPLLALHDHNEQQVVGTALTRLAAGEDAALISDAGTPLINDPGYRLVNLAHKAGIPVVPVPGPSAVLAALSVSGLAINRFAFEGFVPSRAVERRHFFRELATDERAIVLFEVPHRLQASVKDMHECFGAERKVCVARELTKLYEQVTTTDLSTLCAMIGDGRIPCRGEFVIIIDGAKAAPEQATVDAERLLSVLLQHLPPGESAAVVAELTGRRRKDVYAEAVQLRDQRKADGRHQ